jgi:hypothetical protein
MAGARARRVVEDVIADPMATEGEMLRALLSHAAEVRTREAQARMLPQLRRVSVPTAHAQQSAARGATVASSTHAGARPGSEPNKIKVRVRKPASDACGTGGASLVPASSAHGGACADEAPFHYQVTGVSAAVDDAARDSTLRWNSNSLKAM